MSDGCGGRWTGAEHTRSSTRCAEWGFAFVLLTRTLKSSTFRLAAICIAVFSGTVFALLGNHGLRPPPERPRHRRRPRVTRADLREDGTRRTRQSRRPAGGGARARSGHLRAPRSLAARSRRQSAELAAHPPRPSGMG